MIQPANVHGSVDGDGPDLLPVRMLNKYAYCPRLFHLMHVEGRWADNAFTVDGRNVHRRADQLDHVLPDPENGTPVAREPSRHFRVQQGAAPLKRADGVRDERAVFISASNRARPH